MTEPKRVVITGVSGGIGSACARIFLADGWLVIGFDRVEPDPLEGLTYIECDLGVSESVVSACARAQAVGPLHALVNNAAVQVNKPLLQTTDEEWALVMDTNVRGAFECMRGLLEPLSATSGAVVNVASVHAVATSQNISAYAASKGALVALTRAAAVELAHEGVRCNALLPGAVDTHMLRDGLSRRPHVDGPEGNFRELLDRTPLKMIATPDDIAKSVLFLADGERSPYITGQSLVADGGATARLSTE